MKSAFGSCQVKHIITSYKTRSLLSALFHSIKQFCCLHLSRQMLLVPHPPSPPKLKQRLPLNTNSTTKGRWQQELFTGGEIENNVIMCKWCAFPVHAELDKHCPKSGRDAEFCLQIKGNRIHVSAAQ